MKEIEPPKVSEEFTGVFIPAQIWLHPQLNCVEKCLLAEIGALGGHRGECKAGNGHLGRHVGVGANRVSTMIAHLCELGLAKIVSFNGRVRCLQVFYDTKAASTKKVRQPIEKSKGSLIEKGEEETVLEMSLETKDEDGVLPLPKKQSENTSEDFEQFWKLYPKKAGKFAAEKAWFKIKGVLLVTILTAVKRQKASEQWQKDGGRYIPNPATWLNQGRWMDEVKTAEENKNPNEPEY